MYVYLFGLAAGRVHVGCVFLTQYASLLYIVYCSYLCGCDLSLDHTPQPIRAAMEQLARASAQQVHMLSVVAKQQKEEDRMEDLAHTADAYRRGSLVMRCFTAWVHFVAMAGKTTETQVQCVENSTIF